ncbi:unnamed protein product, partial [Rotaria sordida]
VLILAPTRESCVQILQVFLQLTQFTHNITICLSTSIFFFHVHIHSFYEILLSGLDLKSQEAALRLQPDIVIATSDRLIDHIHNSSSFTVQNIEILVLHEANREAIIAALRTQTFHYRVIAVAQTKWQCHRMYVMLGLLGFKI